MRLQSIEQKNGNKYSAHLGTLLLAAFLAAATLAWSMSAFGITLGSGGMLGGSLKGGMIRVWNLIADTLGNSDYLLLSKLGGASDGSGLFLFLVGLAFIVLSFAVLRANKFLLLIFLVPFLGIQLFWNVQPSTVTSIVFIGALVSAFIYHLHSAAGKLVNAVALLCMMGIISSIVFFVAGDDYHRPAAFGKMDSQIQSTLERIRYGSNIRGDGTLRPRDFDQDKTALEVKMDQPGSMYLRGFVGSNYTKGQWTLLENREYYEQTDLFYWLEHDGFSGLTQLSTDAELSGELLNSSEIEITNKAASRKYIYTPYELINKDIADSKSWSDSFLTSDKLFGTKTYKFAATENMVKDWPALTAKLFSMKRNDDLEKYRLLESYYNVQVYNDYRDLSLEQKKSLKEHFGSAGDQEKGHIDYKVAFNRIQSNLGKSFTYTEDLEDREDPLEDFLESKKGCDVDFATLSTLLFRYYGIPARYVEGYIITPEDAAEKAAGEPILIPASNNHAWTEIYVDSFGWVPVEVTPEFSGTMEKPDLSKGLENQKAENEFKAKKQKQGNKGKDAESSGDGSGLEGSWQFIMLMLAADLILAVSIASLVGLILWLRQRMKRNEAFNNPNVKEAICAIYEYMLQKELPMTDQVREVGNRAAYSTHIVEEQDRRFMLTELKRMQKSQQSGKAKNEG